MPGETEPSSVEQLSESAIHYLEVISFSLLGVPDEDLNFQMHYPAPLEVSQEELEVIVSELRLVNWVADLVPIEEGEKTLVAVRVRNSKVAQ
jgi:hypothetical protein